MRRYDIVKGDTTTAGGVVQAGDGKDLIGDREQAYENDPDHWRSIEKPPVRTRSRGRHADNRYDERARTRARAKERKRRVDHAARAAAEPGDRRNFSVIHDKTLIR